jgi:hypothetical protein
MRFVVRLCDEDVMMLWLPRHVLDSPLLPVLDRCMCRSARDTVMF